ncbi:hypothetical protein BDR03DRAFT_879757 [Suillus americanus]|nr:hypothetical protein BDR03DRAFT_879757 [Suillus americanus]
MNCIISATWSDDSTHLKSQIGHYAAPLPAKEPLSLPVNNGTSSRSHLGVNHPVLASFLCPIMAVKEYHQYPAELGHKKNWQVDRYLCLQLIFLHTYLWEGMLPGEKYDEDSMTDGLFKGYFLVCIMRHIFTGPSTALGEDSHATWSCNASLHDMTAVQPEHIAYACIQVSIFMYLKFLSHNCCY